MTDTPKGRLKTHTVERTAPCSGCGAAVKIRRPSHSGTHWCIRKECQTAKQRFYQKRRSTEAVRIEEMEKGRALDYVVSALTHVAAGNRVVCDTCGRTDAVPGATHPGPDLQSNCRALVKQDPPAGVGTRVVLAIWPELRPIVEPAEKS